MYIVLLPSIHCIVKFVYYILGNGTFIGETKGDNTRFQFGINPHISDCKTGDSTCKFPRHVFDCNIKNNCIEEPFFSLNTMLRLNKNDRLETRLDHTLPHIINEIIPLILEKWKAIIEENRSSLFRSFESKSNKNLKENVNAFIHENQDIFGILN